MRSISFSNGARASGVGFFEVKTLEKFCGGVFDLKIQRCEGSSQRGVICGCSDHSLSKRCLRNAAFEMPALELF
jgi:hypothetical protein